MKNLRLILPVTLATIILSSATSLAQNNVLTDTTPRRIDDLLKRIIDKHDVPGMVAAIVEGDRIMTIGAAGLRKRGGKKPVTIDDQFHIGSDTKAMTATLIAMLVEEGKLTWSTTLAEVFPDLVENMHPAWQRVTLEQLLTHRAGAPGHLENDPIWSKLWTYKGPMPDARRLVVEKVSSRPPETEPGKKFIYSNAGYIIAGAVAEQITGKPWEELIQERLFKPLGMSSAGFGAPGTPGKLDQPWGHAPGGTAMSPGPRADNPPALGPAGTVHCTITDWAKFVALHLRGDRGDAKILKPETFKKLHAPAPGPEPKYAMGWGIEKRDGAGKSGRVLRHAGSNTMWLAVVWIAPEENFAVLVMCNQGDDPAHKACDEVVQTLVRDHGERQAKPSTDH